MKRNAWIGLLMSLPLLSWAQGGSGARNGGSGMRCGHRPLVLADYLMSLRSTSLPEIADRELFFETVLRSIHHPIFAELVAKQWDEYGDSEFWPVGSLEDVEVYYYEAPTHRVKYDASGVIPANNPEHSICVFPAYDGNLCCDRVLISYFGPTGLPTRLLPAYRQLTRYQKNILEMHEAVYRAARTLALLPPPHPSAATLGEIRQFQERRPEYAELPATWVERLVADFLSIRADVSRVQSIDDLWAWSAAIYGAGGEVKSTGYSPSIPGSIR